MQVSIREGAGSISGEYETLALDLQRVLSEIDQKIKQARKIKDRMTIILVEKANEIGLLVIEGGNDGELAGPQE